MLFSIYFLKKVDNNLPKSLLKGKFQNIINKNICEISNRYDTFGMDSKKFTSMGWVKYWD